MAEDPKGAASEAASSASETLSQLLARILNQLALSAWLPSAALTLLFAFIFQLGSVLDGGERSLGPGKAISQTFQALGKMSIGALILLVIVIIVLTMLTQAFSFEAIRVLEGYWGTSRLFEAVAGWKCERFRRRRRRLDEMLLQLNKRAWVTAEDRITQIQQDLLSRGKPAPLTPNTIEALKARALRLRLSASLNDDEKSRVKRTDWKDYASPELLRRRVSVQKRLRDYPKIAHVMPTRLGNVLRHHEDLTGRQDVESLVDELFDTLPFTLRLNHDEQRSRLDLYCSMVFVLAFTAVVAIARFWAEHWGYAVSAIVLCTLGSLFLYRAAVASARAYGATLVIISRYGSLASTQATATPSA